MRKVVPLPLPREAEVPDATHFGAIVRAARTQSGLTLADAAALLGIAKQTLSNLETGQRSVSLSTALASARALGVAVFAVPAAQREPVRHVVAQCRAQQAQDGT
jgi:transcriptional regulator with XRE-family HTH domain